MPILKNVVFALMVLTILSGCGGSHVESAKDEATPFYNKWRECMIDNAIGLESNEIDLNSRAIIILNRCEVEHKAVIDSYASGLPSDLRLEWAMEQMSHYETDYLDDALGITQQYDSLHKDGQ